MAVTHTFVSAVGDGGDAGLVRPSNWNATHTVSIVGTDLGTVFGATGGRLYNIILAPISGKIVTVANAKHDLFAGAIDDNAGAHGGQGLDATHVPYDGHGTTDDWLLSLSAYDGAAFWGQFVLWNTTRGTSRKIVDRDEVNDIIETTNTADAWADGDVITLQSTTNASAGYVDIDVSDNIATTDAGIVAMLQLYDKEGIGDAVRSINFHPFEAYDAGKRIIINSALADQNQYFFAIMPIVSQKLTVKLDSGCEDVFWRIWVMGRVEYADT